ncbi:hypothetical protein ANTQUA_LOCUS1632 [Anthophora quadrimaculata]
MGSRQRYLEEQLQRRESETLELRRNHRELETKFFQLERAFEINLRSQTHREVEFNRMKLEGEDLRKLNGETVAARTELNSRLMNAITERDHWKNAFLQQGEFIKRNKIEFDNAMALVKREYEDILKITRENAEKQLHEIVQLYDEAREKVTRLEGHIEKYQLCEREQENRTFELANLLETLKRFDVDVGSVCQLAAEALKNMTERGNLFEESMRNLRHLAWIVTDRKDEPQLVLLREQNSVLKEVVKNLKRKMIQQQTHNEIPERETEQRNKRISHEIERKPANVNVDLLDGSTCNENITPPVENSINSLIRINNNGYDEKRREHDEKETCLVIGAQRNDNRSTKVDIESSTIDKYGKVLCIESHCNGVAYEEYVFKLSIDREIKLKYPVLLNNNDQETVKVEFVDNEADYETVPLDRMLILFKNIYAVVNVKQTGVPCSTQTTKMKTSNNFTQTALTGINSFSRLNVGVTVSEGISRFLL